MQSEAVDDNRPVLILSLFQSVATVASGFLERFSPEPAFLSVGTSFLVSWSCSPGSFLEKCELDARNSWFHIQWFHTCKQRFHVCNSKGSTYAKTREMMEGRVEVPTKVYAKSGEIKNTKFALKYLQNSPSIALFV